MIIAAQCMDKSPCCTCNVYICLVVCDHRSRPSTAVGGMGTDTGWAGRRWVEISVSCQDHTLQLHSEPNLGACPNAVWQLGGVICFVDAFFLAQQLGCSFLHLQLGDDGISTTAVGNSAQVMTMRRCGNDPTPTQSRVWGLEIQYGFSLRRWLDGVSVIYCCAASCWRSTFCLLLSVALCFTFRSCRRDSVSFQVLFPFRLSNIFMPCFIFILLQIVWCVACIF